MITCPTYTVTIHADGRVDWLGSDGVKVPGEAHGAIDRGGLAQLAVAIDASRFFERDEYGELPVTCPPNTRFCFPDITICSDTPLSIITVTRGAVKKRIANSHCTPNPDLDALEKLIDTVAKTSTWIGP